MWKRLVGVEFFLLDGGLITLLILEKLRILPASNSRQTVGAKVYGQEGNSPDCVLRSLKIRKWVKALSYCYT